MHITAKNAEGGPKILRLLLRLDMNILMKDKNGLVSLQTLLRIYPNPDMSKKDLLIYIKLLSKNPDSISHKSYNGVNVLYDAIRYQYIFVLRYLINRAPLNTINA